MNILIISIISFLIVVGCIIIGSSININTEKCDELKVPIGIANCLELSEAYECCRYHSMLIKQTQLCDDRYIELILKRCN